jgi:hypothetical protein
MANPNNVWKYAPKNPWHPVVYNVSRQAAEEAVKKLVAEGTSPQDIRRTSMWMKKARVRLHSVWLVRQ